MKYLRQLLKQYTEKTLIVENLDQQLRSAEENQTTIGERRNEIEDIDTLSLQQSRISTLEKENLMLKKELEHLSSSQLVKVILFYFIFLFSIPIIFNI